MNIKDLTIVQLLSPTSNLRNKKIKKFALDENSERGNWSGKCDFFLSCVGYAVGLGNIWRFPYLCYRNGGGAFLIPYMIMLAIAGIPLFFFELSLGQFANSGPLAIWRMQPMFKGVGYAMLIVTFITSIYYNVIIAWSFYYFFASLTRKLPWSDCNNEWNDKLCVTNFRNVSLACTHNVSTNCTTYQVAAEQYWERVVLGITDYNGTRMTMEPFLGEVQWHLCLCLLLAWIICVLCLCNGIKSSGKVVYFTALFPYVVIVIMIINGVMMEGSWTGIKYYLIPQWDKLLKTQVWGDAATQIFYSLGVAFGGLLTMSSYNNFNNDCYRDALVVSVINCLTSFVSGLAIFSVLGYIALQTGRAVEDTATGGSGLAFVVYAQSIATMPGAPIFSVLFFVMLLTLGIDSQFGGMEAIFSGLQDEYPILRENRVIDLSFKCSISALMFFFGIPCVSKGGMYMVTIMDDYSGSFPLIIICLFELCVVNYLYGVKNFSRDIKMMLDKSPNIYWKICWVFVTPVVILFILIFSIAEHGPSKYNNYVLPKWANTLGWLMTAAGVISIPIYFIYYAATKGFTKTPDESWGPGVMKFWSGDIRYSKKEITMNSNATDISRC